MRKLLTLIALCTAANFAVAQPGWLDLTFGTGGKVTTDFGVGSEDWGQSVAIQTDGKLVVAGRSNNGGTADFALVRYTTNGALDLTFGAGGIVTTPVGSSADGGKSVAIQTDGKIVVAGDSNNGGYNDFALVRYNTDGALDLTFGTGGIVTTPVASGSDFCRSVAIQTDGKIVVAGYGNFGYNTDFVLVRYTTNGALDLTFGTGGIVTTDFGVPDDWGQSVAIQTDGKLLVAGHSKNGTNWDFALVRYTTNGALDLTFGTGGKVTTDFGVGSDDRGQSVAIQTDGKLVVAGWSDNGPPNYSDFALVRYTTNGGLDITFGTGGIVTTDFGGLDGGYSVAIQTDGKLVVAGRSTNGDLVLVRYTTNGALDLTFGTGGRLTTEVESSFWGPSVAIQTDGKLVVAGTILNGGNGDFALVRYNGEGATSIAEHTMEADFTVYPNPNTGIFTVVMDGMEGIVQLNVMDIRGREVSSQSLTARGRTTHNIDLSGFANGVYTLRIQSAAGVSGVKLVKE